MISIVIPAFNEETTIGVCLESLVAQRTNREFEVIVVDNASTDATHSVALGFAEKLQLRVISESRQGRGAARHRGFREARGSIILSTDADVVLSPDWLDAFSSAVDSGRFVAATGIARIEDCTPLTNHIFNVCSRLSFPLAYILYGHPGLSGFSFSIRRDAYFAAGEFDPDADAYEDLELAMRVRRKVGKIALVKKPTILFSGRRFRKGLLKGWLEYVRTYVQKFIRRKRRVLLPKVK